MPSSVPPFAKSFAVQTVCTIVFTKLTTSSAVHSNQTKAAWDIKTYNRVECGNIAVIIHFYGIVSIDFSKIYIFKLSFHLIS